MSELDFLTLVFSHEDIEYSHMLMEYVEPHVIVVNPYETEQSFRNPEPQEVDFKSIPLDYLLKIDREISLREQGIRREVDFKPQRQFWREHENAHEKFDRRLLNQRYRTPDLLRSRLPHRQSGIRKTIGRNS